MALQKYSFKIPLKHSASFQQAIKRTNIRYNFPAGNVIRVEAEPHQLSDNEFDFTIYPDPDHAQAFFYPGIEYKEHLLLESGQ